MLAERFLENIGKIHWETSTDDDAMKEVDIFHLSMRAFYQKYIEVDCAPLEINISSRRRLKVKEAFEKEITSEFVEGILDAMGCAVEEIISLLTDAAIRYATERSESVSLIF